jgi:hypothetical protein
MLDLRDVIAELMEALEQCHALATARKGPASQRTHAIAKIVQATLCKVTPPSHSPAHGGSGGDIPPPPLRLVG